MLFLFVLRRQNGITAVVSLTALRVEYSLLQVLSPHAVPLPYPNVLLLDFGDCVNSDADGCETRLDTTSNCGSCGNACNFANAAASCPSGTCTLGACTTGELRNLLLVFSSGASPEQRLLVWACWNGARAVPAVLLRSQLSQHHFFAPSATRLWQLRWQSCHRLRGAAQHPHQLWPLRQQLLPHQPSCNLQRRHLLCGRCGCSKHLRHRWALSDLARKVVRPADNCVRHTCC